MRSRLALAGELTQIDEASYLELRTLGKLCESRLARIQCSS